MKLSTICLLAMAALVFSGCPRRVNPHEHHYHQALGHEGHKEQDVQKMPPGLRPYRDINERLVP